MSSTRDVLLAIAGMLGGVTLPLIIGGRPSWYWPVLALSALMFVWALWHSSGSPTESLVLDRRRSVLLIGYVAVLGVSAWMVMTQAGDDARSPPDLRSHTTPIGTGVTPPPSTPRSPPPPTPTVRRVSETVPPPTPPHSTQQGASQAGWEASSTPERASEGARREPEGQSFVALRQDAPLRFEHAGVVLSVTFDNGRLGEIATLRVSSTVAPPIVEAVLGPGGYPIPFQSRSGGRTLTVAAWDPELKTLDLLIDPPIK